MAKASGRWILFAVAIPSAVSLVLETSSSDSSCDCLPWKEARVNHLADCEFINGGGTFQEEMCEKFIGRLPNETFCINTMNYENFREKGTFDFEAKPWCYVSSACESGQVLEWGPMGSNVAKWKDCSDSEAKLGQKRFEQLAKWSEDMDFDVGLVAAFAYKPWTGPERLPHVLGFWKQQDVKDAPPEKFLVAGVSNELQERLQNMVDSGETTFFRSESGHPPFAVAEGNKLYWVNHGDWILQHTQAGGYILEHPGKINLAKCVAGCDKVERPWWHALDK